MINFDIQNHRPLREIVYEELKLQILTGEIKPGTRMMEVELAEDLGVSRTPVREAIRKLEKEGLVTIEPRKGAYASEISMKDMEDILEVRQTIEGLAAGIAAVKITDEQKADLKDVMEKFNKAVEENDYAEMISNDTSFHHLIVEACDNAVLESIAGQLQDRVLRFRYLYFSDFKRAESMPAEHKEIYSALDHGDENAAKQAAAVHIENFKELISNGEV